ncbi:MAG: hypothetical protein WBO34_12340 [Gammaproteobacteria bacterium]
MAILDTLLFGMIAALIALKVALLAAAALLFVGGLASRIRQHKAAPVAVAGRHPRLDEYA